jgi:hypothetical protein
VIFASFKVLHSNILKLLWKHISLWWKMGPKILMMGNAHPLFRHKIMDVNYKVLVLRGTFEKFVDWRQFAAVMQRKAVTVTPSFSGGGNVVVVRSSSL